MLRLALLIASLALLGCGPETQTYAEFHMRKIRMPNGGKVTAEVVTSETDMMRGLMFRDSLAPDRGMLFIHDRPGKYPYWMYQVRIPLDLIWMDPNRNVVEIVANAPPCKTQASQCPNYGGHYDSQYVLEVGGGMAAKYGVKLGSKLEF